MCLFGVPWVFVGFLCGFMVFGVEMLFGLVPFKTSPCSLWCLLSSLSFLFVGMFAGDVFVRVFLFLKRWGNPNPVWGLGFPLCSLLPGHALRPRSVRLAPFIHRGIAPVRVGFFFFLVGARVGLCFGLGFGVLSWLGWWWWSLRELAKDILASLVGAERPNILRPF